MNLWELKLRFFLFCFLFALFVLFWQTFYNSYFRREKERSEEGRKEKEKRAGKETLIVQILGLGENLASSLLRLSVVGGLPGGTIVKNPPANVGNTRDADLFTVLKIPWSRK